MMYTMTENDIQMNEEKNNLKQRTMNKKKNSLLYSIFLHHYVRMTVLNLFRIL